MVFIFGRWTMKFMLGNSTTILTLVKYTMSLSEDELNVRELARRYASSDENRVMAPNFASALPLISILGSYYTI